MGLAAPNKEEMKLNRRRSQPGEKLFDTENTQRRPLGLTEILPFFFFCFLTDTPFTIFSFPGVVNIGGGFFFVI